MLDFGLIGRNRIRLVRQTEISECGLACLAMIANHYGLETDLGTLRRRFAPSLRGTGLRTIMGVADKIGLTPRAVKLPLDDLKKLHLPAVLHWSMNHFVVLESIKGDGALIHDPNGYSAWQSMESVSRNFTGVALELRLSLDFEAGEHRERLRFSGLWSRLTGLNTAVFQTVILSLVLEAFILASPYYLQLAVDSALPALDSNLMLVLALGFGLFTILNVVATTLRSFVLLVAGTTLGYSVAANIARRLFRLPIDWFEKRHTGDILSRFQSIAPIQKLLTEGAVAAMIDGSLAVFTLVLMFCYSVKLAAITTFAFASYGGVRWVSYYLQREAQQASIVYRGKEQTTLIETLRGITTLRLFARENIRHAVWQSRLTDATNAEVRLARIAIWQTTASNAIFGLENVITIWLAIEFVITGQGFSVGMAIAYLAYKTQFIQKATSLIDQTISFRMLGLHLDRLSDIALTGEDRSFVESSDSENELIGRLELRDIRYRYAPSDPLVLDGLDLSIEPGEHLAITGPSGGGKSTLVKIILGLVESETGAFLVDGKPLARFGYQNYREQVAAVLQEDSLFAGSLLENIALFDDLPDLDRAVQAAMAASIHIDIDRMPMKYETLVGDMGSALSGGQKQRVLLARALYRRPKILVMDEGTAHLDTIHEAEVNVAIGSLGITRIIVAHRRETVEAADRVLVLEGGRIRPRSEEQREPPRH